MPAVTSGMRAHICERPSPGVPSSSSRLRPRGDPLLHPGEHRAAEVGAADPLRTRLGRRHAVGHQLELAVAVEGVLAERGVDGEHLGVLDVAHRPRLGDVMALDGEAHVDVDRPPGVGVGEVLGGRPHAAPPRRRLHRLDRRGEAHTAVHEPHRRHQSRRHRQLPAEAVVRGLQTEERPRVHVACWHAGRWRHRDERRTDAGPTMRAMRVPLTVNDFLRRAELLYGARHRHRRRARPAGGVVGHADLRARSPARPGDRRRARRASASRAGERVAIVSHNSARLLTALFGVSGSGRILVPVNFRLVAEEVRYIVEHSGRPGAARRPRARRRAGATSSASARSSSATRPTPR